MKILFIGTVKFSYEILKCLLENSYDVVGVISRKESSFNADFSDLKPLCQNFSINHKYSNSVNDEETTEYIIQLMPDVIYCFGWSELIKETILNIPPLGVIGYHPAELPKNRGRHPIIWALVLGLQKTASTFFFMDKGADSGDILSQEIVDISDEDDALTLYDKLLKISEKQVLIFSEELKNKTYIKIKQDNSLSNYWRKRNKLDGKIDFRMSAKSIYNLVRALTKPYVGAHYETEKGDEIKIWITKVIIDNKNKFVNFESGKVLEVNKDTFIVKCGDNALEIIKHEFKEIPKVGDYL